MRLVEKFKNGKKTTPSLPRANLPRPSRYKNVANAADPVQEAYSQSRYDWNKVKENLKALGLDIELHPDTLAYVEYLLSNRLDSLDISDEQYNDALNIGVATPSVETGGKPSTASKTGNSPTYWGLFLQSKLIIPEDKRTTLVQGTYDLTNAYWNILTDPNKWTNGSYPDPDDKEVAVKENRKLKMINVGFKNRFDTWGQFWGLVPPTYQTMYGLRLIPRNAKVKAATDGEQRPLNREDYAVKLAKVTKALELSVK